jgi:hypothetical protein
MIMFSSQNTYMHFEMNRSVDAPQYEVILVHFDIYAPSILVDNTTLDTTI